METKHKAIRIELTIENGAVTYVRQVQEGEITASFDTFFWIAKQAGYKVIAPDMPVEMNVRTTEFSEVE